MGRALNRIDRLCAGLNAGLAAVAFALALLLLAAATVQAGNYAMTRSLEAPANSFGLPF